MELGLEIVERDAIRVAIRRACEDLVNIIYNNDISHILILLYIYIRRACEDLAAIGRARYGIDGARDVSPSVVDQGVASN